MISLFAGEDRSAKRDRIGDPLQVLDRHIDFAAIAAAIDAKLTLGDRGKGGRPPYPTETMVRLLALQQLYNLSDDALEYQVLDRNSFARFARLTHSSRVPDAKTVWVWREGEASLRLQEFAHFQQHELVVVGLVRLAAGRERQVVVVADDDMRVVDAVDVLDGEEREG